MHTFINYISITVQACLKTCTKKNYESICLIEYDRKVVIRNRAMRTARNVFIVNLAVSDLMLCLITMPLTLVEILYMTWQVSHLNFYYSTLILSGMTSLVLVFEFINSFHFFSWHISSIFHTRQCSVV